MVDLGYKLSSEEFGPRDLVRFAARAERAGFDFALISDHFHPWTDRQGQSPFVWSVIGAIANATTRLRLGTAVTCPTLRVHPAIIAQAAATTAALMEGRFFLGSRARQEAEREGREGLDLTRRTRGLAPLVVSPGPVNRAAGRSLLEAERSRHGVEEVGLVRDADHVGGLRTLRRDADLGAGMALRAAVQVGGVVDDHRLTVCRDQGRDRARAVVAVGLWLDDLAGVAVVGRDDDERVAVRLRPLETDLDGAVELDGLADLPARVLGVVLLVDRGALDLQEEAVPLVA